MSDIILTTIAEAVRKYVVVAGDDPMLDIAENVVKELKSSRMAIVELPESTYVDDDAQVFFGEFDIRADPTGTPMYRTVTTDFCMGSEFKVKWSPARAYWWGRHLIAAALETGYEYA